MNTWCRYYVFICYFNIYGLISLTSVDIHVLMSLDATSFKNKSQVTDILTCYCVRMYGVFFSGNRHKDINESVRATTDAEQYTLNKKKYIYKISQQKLICFLTVSGKQFKICSTLDSNGLNLLIKQTGPYYTLLKHFVQK